MQLVGSYTNLSTLISQVFIVKDFTIVKLGVQIWEKFGLDLGRNS